MNSGQSSNRIKFFSILRLFVIAIIVLRPLMPNQTSFVAVANGPLTKLINAFAANTARAAVGTSKLASAPARAAASATDFDNDGVPNANECVAPEIVFTKAPIGIQVWKPDVANPGTFLTTPVNTNIGNSFDTGDGPTEAAFIGDTNGDGIGDVLWALEDNYVIVYLGNSDGTFNTTPLISDMKPVGTFDIGFGSFISTQMNDVTGDGIPDLVTGFEADHSIRVWPGLGNGYFRPGFTYSLIPTLLTGVNNTEQSFLIDVTGDGRPDWVNAYDALGMYVWPGLPEGRFDPTPIISSMPSTWHAGSDANQTTEMGDVTGDGIADLVWADTTTHQIVVTVGQGNGTFSTSTLATAMGAGFEVGDSNVEAAFLTDQTKDGNPDLIWSVNGAGLHEIRTYIGLGDGHFDPAYRVSDASAGMGFGFDVTMATKLNNTLADTDRDGVMNCQDPDDDNDRVPTLTEGPSADTDGDGTPNYRDIDDDGDGISTRLEDTNGDGNPTNDDVNNNGIPAYLDATEYGPDTDADTVPNSIESRSPKLVVGATSPFGNITTWIGRGDGSLVYNSSTINSPVSSIMTPGALDAGDDSHQKSFLVDVTADGIPDWVFLVDAVSVLVFPGLGNDKFDSNVILTNMPGNFEAGVDHTRVSEMKDVTGDGLIDIAVGDEFHNVIQVWRGIGAGKFATTAIFTNFPPGFAVGENIVQNSFLADVTGDGMFDWIAVVGDLPDRTYVRMWPGLSGTDRGKFSLTYIETSMTGVATWGAGTGTGKSTFLDDINRDGKPDLVSGYAQDRIDVWLGNGNGTFQQTPIRSTMSANFNAGLSASEESFLVDYNQDGKLDWLYATTWGTRTYFGNGDGTFQTSFVQSMPTATSLGAGSTADVSTEIDVSPIDTDADGVPNYNDPDDDGDNVPTSIEQLRDTDGDTLLNYVDSDDDNDGIRTIFEDVNNDGNYQNDDIDVDGIPNYLDADDDGDTIATALEQADPNGDGNPADAVDSNANGIPNYLEGLPSDVAISKVASVVSTNTNSTVVYTLTVSNTSAMTATGVVVTDTLPAGLTGLSASNTANTANPSLTAGQTASWSLGNLGIAATHQIVITATAPSTVGTIINTAGVNATSDASNNNNYASAAVQIIASLGADLTIALGQPVPNLVSGVSSTIDVTVTNAITANATTGNITTTLTLPANVSAPASFSSGGNTCTTTGQTVTCINPGPIAAGSSDTFQVPVTPGAATIGTQPVFTVTTANDNGSVTTTNTATLTAAVAVGVIPTAPVITSPANGSTVSTTTPSLSGSGEAGAILTVTTSPAGTVVCSTTVAVAGTWSCTPSAALAQGSSSMVAVQSNASGLSPASAIVNFDIDSLAPAAPIISDPAAVSTISNTTPTLSGIAEAGSTVVVQDGTTTLCTATADAGGNWSCTPSSALTAGTHNITATATDAAGNTSAASDTNTFSVDTTGPAAPVITAPTNGSVLSNTTSPISGTAEAGSTVVVKDGATTLCTATTNAGGVWSCTPSSALSSGAHSVTATATDAVGNAGAASTATGFTIDNTVPAAPAITSPAASSILSGTPTFSGTAEAGSTVVVKDGTTTLCTATADASGNWSCTPTSALAAGAHSVTTTSTDAAGNTSAASAATNFSIDTGAPIAPVISAPAANGTVSDTTPTFSGSAEAGSTVVVQEGAGTLCTATTNASGNWSCGAPAALSQGAHSVTATATDAVGNTSPASAAHAFNIDNTAPAAPSILQPTASSVLSDTTPTFSGSAEAGSSVVVKDGTTTVCTATADASGNWTCTPTSAMSAGAHSITATATDATGNTGTASTTRAFTIDNTAPAAPVMSNPAASSTTSDSTPTFSGTAEAGSTVTLVEGTTTVCTATADASGNWTCDAPTGMINGAHSVIATATDVAGNVSPATARSFTISNASSSINSPATGVVLSDTTPTFSGTGVPGAAVTVGTSPTGTAICSTTVDAAGNWTCTPTTAMAQGTTSVAATLTDPGGSLTTSPITVTVDSIAPGTPTVSTPAANGDTNDNTPTLTGSAEPGSIVKLIENGVTLCTTTADASGNWSCTPSVGMAEGAHTVSVSATDAAGNTGTTTTRLFTVDTLAPVAPTVSNPTANSVTPSTQPSVSGAADPGSTVTVKEGSTTLCTATADASGNWTCTPTTPLSEGVHNFSITQTDAAGNVSSVTARSFTVDTTAPAAPAIIAPAQNVLVTTTQPSIIGTSEAGAVISVTEGSTTICTATADAGGNWNCAPTSALSQGAHTLTAQASDAGGSASAVSPAHSFTVDTVAPNAPVITAPVSNTTTNDNTPTVSGTAEPGSTVKVSDNGNTVCTAVADANGDWTCEVSTAMSNGSHTVQVVVTDPAGNTSSASSRTFTVSNTTPSISGPTTGSVLSDTTPTFVGTGTPGAPVTVTTSPTGTVLCTTTADANGNWTCTPSTAMPEGKTTVVAQIGDPNGTLTTTPVTFGVDATAPTAPTVTSPAASGKINDRIPQISGTAEPSSTVKVTENGVALCTTVADANGNWSCSPVLPMADGSHTVSVSVTDPAGNSSPATTRTFGVDSVAPAAPTVASPATGSTISDTTPTFSGTGEVGGVVTVTTSPTGTVLCTATVNASGNWSCTATTALDQGPNTVGIVQTDAAGNESQPTTRTFNVDSVLPSAPTLGSPISGGIITDTMPTFAGTGEPGAVVAVTTSPTGTVLCTTTVDANGNWTCTPTTALASGSNTVRIVQTDAAGNTSPALTRNFEIVATPSVDGDGDGVPDSVECPTGTPCRDSDGDGIPDNLDSDDDNDGILTMCPVSTTNQECMADVDGDGIPAYVDPNDSLDLPNGGDSDGDGIPDAIECGNVTPCLDSDGDGIPDFRDTDGDGDGIPDKTECPNANACRDTDGDGKPDYRDNDDDNDGIVTKCPTPGINQECDADADGDGILAYEDPNDHQKLPNGGDADGDGISDTDECPQGTPCPDTDGDGIPDYRDADSDGDGITDKAECPTGSSCPDTDGDGIPDGLEPNNRDTDGDGIPDYKDNDDDNDGIKTHCPVPGSNQECNADQDGDGIPAYLDPNDHLKQANGGDSDGDGIPDKQECSTGMPCPDSDGDGKPDYLDTDGDNDGVPDSIECSTGLPCRDSDGDGIPDTRDIDDDGDGRITHCPVASAGQECEADEDGDGVPAYLDPNDHLKQAGGGDGDGDGISDSVECGSSVLCVDSDRDGIPDYLDRDSDNDGFSDADECVTGVPCVDSDSDGIQDFREPNNRDTDGDGKADNVDSDDDNDGIPTRCPIPGVSQECSADADGDGIPAYLDNNDSQKLANGGDGDGDGVSDSEECATGMPCRDTDGDGKPDYVDGDDDGDGVPTQCPTPATGKECKGDADSDGIPDYLDASASASKRPTITPINGTPNYTPNGLVQLSGTGTPGATITVKEGDQVICTATANALGLWTCEASLGIGTHTLLATDSNNLSSDPTQIVIVVRENVIYLPMVKRTVE